MAGPFVALSCFVSLIAVAGLLKLLSPLTVPAGPLVVAAAAVCGMAAASLLLPATAGFEVAGPGRYVYTALPAGAALFGLGIYTAPARGFAGRNLSGVYAGATIGIVRAPALWPAPGPIPRPRAA